MITNVEVIEKIQKCAREQSQILSLRGLGLKEIPNAVSSLKNIQALDLSHNEIRVIPTFISNLSDLRILDLENNLITDISPLRTIPKIKILNLSNNNISLLPLDEDFWRFDYLDELKLSHNNIHHIPASISNSKFLLHIDLSRNRITVLPEELKELRYLHVLNLGYNELKIIPKWLFEFKRINEVSFDKCRNYSMLFLKGNPIQSPPLEILDNNLELIFNYYQEKEKQGTDKLYEAKIIILGEPGAGKTTLTRKFLNIHSAMPKGEETTRGIDIRPWKFNTLHSHFFRANIWDFGGQQIYHSTHRYFLTNRSLYILLSDNRKENFDIKYWLEITNLFADESPVYILQNEIGGRRKELDVIYERKHFKNLKNIFSADLSNSNDNRLKDFIELVKAKLLELPHIGNDVPKKWLEIRAILEKKAGKYSYVTQNEYFDICRNHDIDSDEGALLLSGYFHDLGVFLHFKNNPILKHWIILQPTWATEAVYKILDNPKAIGGIVKRDAIDEMWNKHDKFDKMHDELLSLMTEFQICYETLDKKKYVIPQLLNIKRPSIEWNIPNELKLSFKYDFLPKGIIHQIILRLHKFIKSQDHENNVWFSGALLENEGSIGLIIEDYRDNMIHIKVAGELLDTKRFLLKIENEIDEIHELYPSTLEVDKLIPCNCVECKSSHHPYFFPFKRINNAFSRGVWIYRIKPCHP